MENSAPDGQQQPPAPSTPQDAATLKKFDTYPWAQDRQFLQGLAAMLGPLDPRVAPNGTSPQSLAIALQARIWWYHSREGVTIDREAYEAYHRDRRGGGSSISSSSSTPSSSPDPAPRPDAAIVARLEDIQRRMAAMAEAEAGAEAAAVEGSAAASALPAWQNSSHVSKVDLSKKADDGAGGHGGGGGGGGGGDAPYPAHFQAIIEAVTQGKPVPGVKDIPNTVVRQPGISPIGKMQAPRKPWEAQLEGASAGDSVGESSQQESVLDNEFPPVDEGTGEILGG